MILKRLALIIACVLVIGVAGIVFMFTSWTGSAGGSDKKVIEDGTFKNIEVVSDNALVQIVPTKNSTTTVEYTGEKKKNKKYTFNVDVKGDTLFIQLKEKRRGFFNFDFSFSSMSLTIQVPENQYNMIKAVNNNGKIQVENMNVGELVLETDNGNIELKDIEASSVDVKSDNGKIILEHVEGAINGETDNGTISFVTNNLDRSIELKTDNGRIEIQTDNEPTNAFIDAKTDLGKIDIFGSENKNVTFGAGEHLIKLKTDNGRITVTK